MMRDRSNAELTIRLLAGTVLLAAEIYDRRLGTRLPCWTPSPTRLLALLLRTVQQNLPPHTRCGP